MREFVIIADDFTGANDTGVQIRKKGIPLDVLLEVKETGEGNASLVIDTESRVIPPDAAYERTVQVMESVLAQGCHYLYKKVDSTLRGNLQAEIRALVKTYAPELIIFAPAYPAQGRTVLHGRLCVQGTPLLETEIAADPRNPLQADNIQDILRQCVHIPVAHYGLPNLEEGNLILKPGAYTFDTLSAEHLCCIAKAALGSGLKTLWIGSAGLAEGLLSVLYPPQPVLAVIGSVSSKTMEQIDYCRHQGVAIVCLDMGEICEGRDIVPYLAETVWNLKNGKDVILTAAASRQDYEKFCAYGRTHGKSNDELAEITKRTLSEALPAILSQVSTAGLFLTGGDTAIAAIYSLKAVGSHIERQILPGFVQGRLIGGLCNDLPIVTKAGAFGSETDIYDSIRKLKELEK